MGTTCYRKKRYRQEIDAKIVLSRLVYKDHGEKRVYRCPFCNGFHLTSQADSGYIVKKHKYYPSKRLR